MDGPNWLGLAPTQTKKFSTKGYTLVFGKKALYKSDEIF